MRVCVCEGGEQRSNARFVLLYERKREREIVRGSNGGVMQGSCICMRARVCV